MKLRLSLFSFISIWLFCWFTLPAQAQIEFDKSEAAKPLPTPYTIGVTRDRTLEIAREILNHCQIPFQDRSGRLIPNEDVLVTDYILFAEDKVTSRTDLAHYTKLPANDPRVWTGGRVRLEARALPLDESRSQIVIAARFQGRVAPIGAYSRNEEWVDCESNGRLEDEVLRGLAGKLLGIDLSIDRNGRRRILKCEY